MTILPYNQNHELKEGWLKTIEAIEKRCIRSFPDAIKQHKVYSKGSCSCEEITELVGMVRKHQKSYSKIHHRAILSTLSFVKVSILHVAPLFSIMMEVIGGLMSLFAMWWVPSVMFLGALFFGFELVVFLFFRNI
jgi:hypothetical protein